MVQLPHWKDLTGFRSGWLEVLSRVEGSGGRAKHTKWKCLCHRCGNTIIVESSHLTSKWRPQLSCCLKGSYDSSTYKDLTGQRFGLLTVENIAQRGAKNKHIKWNCVCDCGNRTVVSANDLKKGSTISCGCKAMSKGEIAVNSTLKAYNISYYSQYPLYELTTSAGGTPRMDFAIIDDMLNIIAFIEYQGEQHYKDMGIYGKLAREETDAIKKKYCSEINIPLYEIRYDENPTQAVYKILSILKLIPCQASQEEGVTTIPKGSRDTV